MGDCIETGEMHKHEPSTKVTLSCGHLLHQICNLLVVKGLLDSKEANCFIQWQPPKDLEAIKRLLILFNRRGAKSFHQFLCVLRNVEGYPELSSHIRKVVDNYEVHSKASAFDSSKNTQNLVSSEKRRADLEEANELGSAKRTRSFVNLNSDGIVLVVGRDVSRKREQKALHRLSFLARASWNDQIFFNEDEQSKGDLLQVEDHQDIGISTSEDDPIFQKLLSKSKYNLNDLENGNIPEEFGTFRRSSLRTKLKALGLFLIGVVGTVVYVGLRSNKSAEKWTVSHINNNASMWDKNGLFEVADYDIETIEAGGNSSWWNYRFAWQGV